MILAIVVLASMLYIEKKRAAKLKAESQSQRSILEMKESEWKTKHNQLVHEVDVANITSKQVAKQVFKQDSIIKALQVNFRDVKGKTTTVIENHYHIEAPLRSDTSHPDTLKFEYKGRWLTTNGTIDLKNKKIVEDYTHRDTINQVISYSQKKILFIPIGPIKFKSETINADTSSRIVHQTVYVRTK